VKGYTTQLRIVVNFFAFARQKEYAAQGLLDWHGSAGCANLMRPSPLEAPQNSEVE